MVNRSITEKLKRLKEGKKYRSTSTVAPLTERSSSTTSDESRTSAVESISSTSTSADAPSQESATASESWVSEDSTALDSAGTPQFQPLPAETREPTCEESELKEQINSLNEQMTGLVNGLESVVGEVLESVQDRQIFTDTDNNYLNGENPPTKKLEILLSTLFKQVEIHSKVLENHENDLEAIGYPEEVGAIATACLFDRAVLNLVESEVEAYDAVKRVLPGRDDAEDRLELVKNIIKEAEKVENADNDEEKRRLPIFQTLRIALSNQGLDSGDSKVCSLVSKVKGKAASFKEEAESGTDSSPEGGG